MVKKTAKTEEITSNVPTHWELAMWVAPGKGEVLDTNNFNGRIHSFDFKMPLDGALRTWKAGCMSTTQSYISLPLETPGAWVVDSLISNNSR